MWSLVTSEGLVKQILDTQENGKVAKIFMGQVTGGSRYRTRNLENRSGAQYCQNYDIPELL